MIVSAILPTYNEEQWIGACLSSLLQQRGIEDYEILVIDGGSKDRTLDVVRSFPEFGSKIKILENPRRYQVFAWNIGCAVAQGEYIAFAVAHTTYRPNHFQGCLEAMERTGADAVGPVQIATGSGALGTAIAWCMSSPFGIGNARFRFTHREEEVDSVFSMFLRREAFRRLGGYDERVLFDEDSEFCYRLRAAGGRIVVSPAIAVRYFARTSLRGLSRQMFCYGYWRRFTQVLHPNDVPSRVYAPPALVAGFILSLLLALTPLRMIAPLLPLVYLAYTFAASMSALPKVGLPAALCVPLALPCMHISYGLGFLRALFTSHQRILVSTARRSIAR
ncbi:MAG: glycosyltransferase family 2 protein [Candidatus Eremiobacteraeota bacterium]|nr:glycosyltransferase family 2 protein [Candidatus Eremiobacteraeota bacterium]